jgi:hypothetical protein
LTGFSGYVDTDNISNWYFTTTNEQTGSSFTNLTDNIWKDIQSNFIQSFRHVRSETIASTNTNAILSNTKAITIYNVMDFTDITNGTAVLNGTRTHSVYHNNLLISGTWTVNYTLSNVQIAKTVDSTGATNTSITTTANGFVKAIVQADWTNKATGKEKSLNETNDIIFNGTKTVQITSGGVTVNVDITTGETN